MSIKDISISVLVVAVVSLGMPVALKLDSFEVRADNKQIAVSAPPQASAPAPSGAATSSPTPAAMDDPPSEVPIMSTPVPDDPAAAAAIEGPEPVRSKLNMNKTEAAIPLEINANSSQKSPPVQLFVSLDVPHHSSNTVSFCAIYPYPQTLPIRLHQTPPLDTKTFAIRTLLLNTAYARKTMKTVAYPQGGWRWQEAYERALKRSGREEPHVVLNLYPFINDLVPYCREEVKRSNEFEEKRVERYDQAVKDLAETKADTETEATRKGMVPVSVRYTKFFPNGIRQGIVRVMPGHWWVIATHKVPGLTYYWQEPVAIQPGEPAEIVLSEKNALLIEGAW
ncbi:MAG TPA: hypothetical protein V6C69_17460 [Trichormus sp.]